MHFFGLLFCLLELCLIVKGDLGRMKNPKEEIKRAEDFLEIHKAIKDKGQAEAVFSLKRDLEKFAPEPILIGKLDALTEGFCKDLSVRFSKAIKRCTSTQQLNSLIMLYDDEGKWGCNNDNPDNSDFAGFCEQNNEVLQDSDLSLEYFKRNNIYCGNFKLPDPIAKRIHDKNWEKELILLLVLGTFVGCVLGYNWDSFFIMIEKNK